MGQTFCTTFTKPRENDVFLFKKCVGLQIVNVVQKLQGVRTLMTMLRAGASDSPKLWGAMGSDLGSMSPPQAATSRVSHAKIAPPHQSNTLCATLFCVLLFFRLYFTINCTLPSPPDCLSHLTCFPVVINIYR